MKILMIFVLFFYTPLTFLKTVYIIPGFGYTSYESLFDIKDRDGVTIPFIAMRDALLTLGYNVSSGEQATTCDDGVAVIVLNMPNLSTLQQLINVRCKKIVLLFEPPTILPANYDVRLHALFDTVYTMMDNMIDHKHYHKLYYPQPSLEMSCDAAPFNEKKLCTLIANNKMVRHPAQLYTARREIIQFFAQSYLHDFDLYGSGWSAAEYPSYRGKIVSKKECLANYKFCICYENTRDLSGYVTEKIFDCFVAGCVPVYWGADNITDFVPANCFIDRRLFASNEQLYTFLTQMRPEHYYAYVCEIKLFLSSVQAFRFSTPFFVHTILKAIEPGYQKSIIFSSDIIDLIEQVEIIDQRIGILE